MHHGERSGPESAESLAEAWRDHPEPFPTFPPAATGHSGSSSGGVTSSNQDATQQSSSPPEDGRLRVIKRLEKEIDSFRSDEASKTSTIASILGILSEDSDVEITQSQRESTFSSYLTEILAIESSRDQAQDVGCSDNPTPLRSSIQPSGTKPHSRKPRDPESDSGDDEDRPSKKPKLEESDLPWHEPASDPVVDLGPPSCQETCRLLRIYNRDIAKAKFCVRVSRKSPPGIPSSQWERILKGETVDLNQVFSSLHHVVVDEERTGRLGSAEITFGVSEPKRRIATAAEWSIAWRKASKAISFAFPHRREELLEYGDYIESEFAAKIVSSHHKLLLYDVALRNEVAAGQHFLLTDHNRFSRLYSAIVMPDGVEANAEGPISTSRKPSKPKGSDKPELCNKFNAGSCKKPDAECKYRHLCKSCGRAGHGSKDCPDGSK
jgi:hypothetical protein